MYFSASPFTGRKEAERRASTSLVAPSNLANIRISELHNNHPHRAVKGLSCWAKKNSTHAIMGLKVIYLFATSQLRCLFVRSAAGCLAQHLQNRSRGETWVWLQDIITVIITGIETLNSVWQHSWINSGFMGVFCGSGLLPDMMDR